MTCEVDKILSSIDTFTTNPKRDIFLIDTRKVDMVESFVGDTFWPCTIEKT
jgi:hypothetical protein